MYNGYKILGVITARGGSKGLPRKNILPVAGKPLLAWTIEAGLSSKYMDRLILSSDDAEIIDVAKDYNCEVPFVRPQEMAADETSSVDVIQHAIRTLDCHFDYIVVLQPTSPLRLTKDIDGCIEMCIRENADSCVTVCESKKPPQWLYCFDGSRLNPIIKQSMKTRRQDVPSAFFFNGAVYVCSTASLLTNKELAPRSSVGYRMPMARSYDIDDEHDLEICDFLLRKRKEND